MEKNIFYDKDLRNKIRQLDEESLTKIMASHLKDTQVKVLVNTKDTFYFVIPDKESSSNIDLQSIQAAGGAASSIATVGTLGCASSTVSTSGTASSAAPKTVNDLLTF